MIMPALFGQTLELTAVGVGVGTSSPARKLDIGGGYAYSLGGTVMPVFQTVGSGGNSGTYGGAYFVTQSSDTAGGLLVLAKAKSDTIGNLAAVQSGDQLGAVHFFGADGTTLIRGARIASFAESNASTNSLAGNLIFSTSTTNSLVEQMRITSDGKVGIGTNAPGYKLEVAGSVRALSFISNSTTYADFVFSPSYKLAELSEVEAQIRANGHLPDIPSAAEAKAQGIDLAAMQVKLLQKIEELTLHQIAQEKEIKTLRSELDRLTTPGSRLK